MRGLVSFLAVCVVSLAAEATYLPPAAATGEEHWSVVDVPLDGTGVNALPNTLYVGGDGTTDTVIALPASATNTGRQVAFAYAAALVGCPYFVVAPAAGDRIEDWDADRRAILFATEGAGFRLTATASGWHCTSGCEWLDIDPRSIPGIKAWYDVQCGVTTGAGNSDSSITILSWKDLSGTDWHMGGTTNLNPPNLCYDGVSRSAVCTDAQAMATASQRQLDGTTGMAALVVARFLNGKASFDNSRRGLLAWNRVGASDNTRGFVLGSEYNVPARMSFSAGPQIVGSASATGHLEMVSTQRRSRAGEATTGPAGTSLFSVRAVDTFGFRINASTTNGRSTAVWAGTPFAPYSATYGYLRLFDVATSAGGHSISSALLYDTYVSEADFAALERMLMRRYGLAR